MLERLEAPQLHVVPLSFYPASSRRVENLFSDPLDQRIFILLHRFHFTFHNSYLKFITFLHYFILYTKLFSHFSFGFQTNSSTQPQINAKLFLKFELMQYGGRSHWIRPLQLTNQS